MIAPAEVTVILLAAGLSRRFGDADKLDALLEGEPLRLHAARTLAGMGFGRLIAVCRDEDAALAALGFEIFVNADPSRGQASSIRVGLDALFPLRDASESWHLLPREAPSPDGDPSFRWGDGVGGRDGRDGGVGGGGDGAEGPILIALADMPRITAAHVNALLAAFEPGRIVASHDGARPMPPALFDVAFAGQLGALTGDHGARDLLRTAIHVHASPAILADIDTPDQL